MTVERVKTAENGRQSGGKFGPGNSFASGQRRRLHAGILRQAFAEAISEDDVRELALAILTQAQKGDLGAAKLLLERCLGKPEIVPEFEVTEEIRNRILAILDERRDAESE